MPITFTQESYVLIAGIIFLSLVAIILVRIKAKQTGEATDVPKTKEALFVPKTGFAASIKRLLIGNDKKIDEIIPELEEILLTADVGVPATQKLVQEILSQKDIKDKAEIFEYLRASIQRTLTPKNDFSIALNNKPCVIYLVGVNGVGKTTTIGKLASQYKKQGLKVMMVAADTFRAAAIEQLRIWSQKNAVDFVGGQTGSDPSSVIVDGLRSAVSKNIDVVLVDTAGRLQTKTNLMNELKKMVSMSEKVLNKKPDEVFLVVDAVTGQNGFSQAKIFCEAIEVSGVILTKYDATSKGGIILSIVSETGLPVRYIGLGEGPDDLKVFDAKDFVVRLFS